MKKWSLVALVSFTIISCSQYQKVLKSDNYDLKIEEADRQYEAKKYSRAYNLYDQIFTKERWNQKHQDINYRYGKSMYLTEKYQLSGIFFTSYNLNFVNSPYQEEAYFLEAMSEYHLTDVSSKDQQRTKSAITKFEKYFEKFPNGEKKEEATKYYLELKRKLEKKAFDNAQLYNKIGEYTRDYNAAIVALDNFMLDNPGSIYKEDALFYKFDSAYKLAINSVYSKMEERINNAISSYNTLIAFNENSKYKAKADAMLATLNKELQQFSK